MNALIDILQGRRIAILTGAGCSTESGIPDYRGPLTRHKARNPIQYKAFIGEPEARQRYWSRSVIGWQRVEAAAPNDAHKSIARLEAARLLNSGLLSGVITQNVDRLHHKAGSRRNQGYLIIVGRSRGTKPAIRYSTKRLSESQKQGSDIGRVV